MAKPIIYFTRCGTREEWDKAKNRPEYQGMNIIIPCEVLINNVGLCLVTSQEWKDWLLGNREDIPT